jgi:CHAT domain-containing protein
MEHGARLGRLPHAEDEGRRLVRRLGGPPSRLWLGKEASEAALGATPLGDYGILHFAAHALVDDERPGRSAVLLAAGSPTEDGLLQPEEIARLELPGKLVVLSACESGAGQMMLGEGTLSLARAFFQAGARTVVASLWRLDDDEAATFFDLFYRALAAGHSVSGALTASQRELQRRGAPAAAWAGVVVLGDGALVPVPGGVRPSPTRRFQVWISVAILVGALVWWLRRRS